MDVAVRALLQAVRCWAAERDWVDWLELGGSLGRGAGDAWSDVDAGIGVDGIPVLDAVAAAREAAASFGPVVGMLTQRVEVGAHLLTAYEDGRQLSLVVVPARIRGGLPPQAVALLDRAGRLGDPLPSSRGPADPATAHEWAFLAWIAVGDAARHARRGRLWRSLAALTEGRDLTGRLRADRLGSPAPRFGAVPVDDAHALDGMRETVPASLDPSELQRAAAALGDVLRAVTPTELHPLAASVRRRLAALRAVS